MVQGIRQRNHCIMEIPTKLESRLVRRGSFIAALAALAMLSGCTSLPASGPTRNKVVKAAGSPEKNVMNFALQDITPATLPPVYGTGQMAKDRLGILAAVTSIERSDIIRPGDTLDVAIYEVGVTLFGSAGALNAGGGNFPAANAQIMKVLVDEDGKIVLPYIGAITASGQTPSSLGKLLEGRLRGLSQSPQVIVSIGETLENNAILSGVITRPGRYRLTSARERLLDLVAIAGGVQGNVADVELRVMRGPRVASVRLADLRNEDVANIVVSPGDRIEFIRTPRSYTVFGATDRVSQTQFETPEVTLAEAIARAAGPSDSRGDAAGVFLFRFEQTADEDKPKPMVYRLNMREPDGYFLAQQIAVQDKDVILFSASPTNLTAKFITLLNQIASPIVTGIVISNSVSNSN